MTEFSSLAAFAGHLTRIAAATEVAERHALEKAAKIIETEAKRVIGTYDYGWTPLAESTKQDRVNKGFPADQPLLRTGKLRDSIKHSVGHQQASVGSNEDEAVWMEFGTKRGVPPRSFLASAAMHKEKEVVAEIGHTVVQMMLQVR